MKFIGIDVQFGDIYRNVGIYYREISPSPIVCEAILDPPPTDVFKNDLAVTEIIFREDVFDPTARLRRGRFYVTTGHQPTRCGVLPRTKEDNEALPQSRDMFTFAQYQFAPQMRLPKLVALGSLDSLWRLASPPERISTGEFLFVLRARNSFGILPEIDERTLPNQGKTKVIETLERLTDSANREAPGSIIDRARDAAQWCLATFAAAKFSDGALLTEDLGPLIRRLEKEKLTSIRAAELVRLLHARAKPNEQERYGARPPMEDDADLAVKAIGFLIREFGWAVA